MQSQSALFRRMGFPFKSLNLGVRFATASCMRCGAVKSLFRIWKQYLFRVTISLRQMVEAAGVFEEMRRTV